jgi:hypothetical protein
VVLSVVDCSEVLRVVDLRVVLRVVECRVVALDVVVVVVDDEDDTSEVVEMLELSAANGFESARLFPDFGIISDVDAALVEPPMDADEKKIGRPGSPIVEEESNRTKYQPTADSLEASSSGTRLNR